ncbi:MAG: Rrf2 family transcriptional regulator [Tepidisphaeraceae bacterium]
MKHGNQVEWALHSVATLAALGPDKRLSATALAEMFEVPPKYLAKALQALSAAGIVASTPGPKGGYALAKSPGEIAVLDVIDAVQGDERIFRCQEIRRRGPCRKIAAREFSKSCQIADVMWRAESAWRRELSSVTFADLGKQVRRELSPVILNVVGSWVAEKAT